MVNTVSCNLFDSGCEMEANIQSSVPSWATPAAKPVDFGTIARQ